MYLSSLRPQNSRVAERVEQEFLLIKQIVYRYHQTGPHSLRKLIER